MNYSLITENFTLLDRKNHKKNTKKKRSENQEIKEHIEPSENVIHNTSWIEKEKKSNINEINMLNKNLCPGRGFGNLDISNYMRFNNSSYEKKKESSVFEHHFSFINPEYKGFADNNQEINIPIKGINRLPNIGSNIIFPDKLKPSNTRDYQQLNTNITRQTIHIEPSEFNY